MRLGPYGRSTESPRNVNAAQELNNIQAIHLFVNEYSAPDRIVEVNSQAITCYFNSQSIACMALSLIKKITTFF